MTSPLRPELYRRLERRIGKVIIANEGEELVGWAATDPCTGRLRLEVSLPGEYYRVCCPFCTDTRHRLYINHRWGLWVPELRSDHLFLARCFNETDCLARPGLARQLRDVVFDDFVRGRAPDPVLRGRRPVVTDRTVKPPGPEVYPLHALDDGHPAVVYLRGRGFDPAWLARQMQVGYCPWAYPEFPMAKDRIIIPVYQGGAYAGWQARFIGEPPDKRVPKYLTMAGMKISQLLYNLDTARQSPFGVVCEGPLDVWAFGPEAVALFGNKLSAAQARLIGSAWREGTVIILLDGDAPGPALQAHDALAGLVRQRAVVSLRPDQDPGGLPRQELRQLVFADALRQGADLGAAASR
jgi:hypothetical protein